MNEVLTWGPIPTIGRVVIYRTDGRNGLTYDLPAIVTCTPDTHPGDYPDGRRNPLPVPAPGCVHLTVFTPGGFGTTVAIGEGNAEASGDERFMDAPRIEPGSGTYVEWNVPQASERFLIDSRSWRWPERV